MERNKQQVHVRLEWISVKEIAPVLDGPACIVLQAGESGRSKSPYKGLDRECVWLVCHLHPQSRCSCVPLRERQIKCPKCDKLFLRTNHLKKHLNSHEGKRDYVCEKCTKAYLTKYHLTRHLKTCKGPTSSSSAQEEDEEDDSEEDDLPDSMRTDDCRMSSAVYSADESLSTHK